jgi:calcineurin-like phosphoesterase family protein
MGQTFFTSDLHVGHRSILKYTERPWNSVEEMDEALVARWNAVVSSVDEVWVLGDYAMGDRSRGLGYLERLHGTKYLVAGNHDKCSLTDPNGWKYIAEYRHAGFEIVTEWAQVKLPALKRDAPQRKVLLSHYPYDGDHRGDDRHVQARLRDYGMPLIHGHVHELYTVRRSEPSSTNPEGGSLQVNCGVDVWGYQPVPALEIARLLDEVERHEIDVY